MSRLLLVFLALLTQATIPPDGTILEDRPFTPPSFEKASGMRPYASPEEYAEATADSRFELRRLVYASDGLPVVAYVYRPVHVNRQLPTIVFNRGGYVQSSMVHQLLPMMHRLAADGFAVIAPMYRGSDGAPGKDEMGGADLNDLMNVQPLARSLDFVDPGQLCLYGESRGGVMALLAARNGFPARAVATFGAFTDLDALIKAAPQTYEPIIPVVWPAFVEHRDRILEDRSAIRWASRINVPLLLMHGGGDRDVNPAQTLALAGELQRLNKPYQLVVYAGDNHVLSGHRVERDRLAASWFRQYLPSAP